MTYLSHTTQEAVLAKMSARSEEIIQSVAVNGEVKTHTLAAACVAQIVFLEARVDMLIEALRLQGVDV